MPDPSALDKPPECAPPLARHLTEPTSRAADPSPGATRAGGEPLARARAYSLTSDLVAANAGGPVVCLATDAVGRVYRLHAERPGAADVRLVTRSALERRAAGVDPLTGEAVGDAVVVPDDPAVAIVTVRGPIEQRAGYHDPCSGWTDGHDAIAERLAEAFERAASVVMVFDSPGGAHAGLQEDVRRALEAKAAAGAYVIGYVDELCGSAAYWWAACVCDEIYSPEAGVTGSIGARSAHASVAGALAKDGVRVTYFAWPNEGKVAFAPELPLSDIARERGERDVADAGEAFAAAVGPRRGLSRDDIVALGADALSGPRALAAGLIDGIASIDDVLAYALTRADGAPTGDTMADEMPDAPEAPPEKPEERAASCGACGVAAMPDARYCAQCGAAIPKMAAEDDEQPDEEDADEPPPSSQPGRAPAPPPAAHAHAPRSLAALAGVREGASMPAILGALGPLVSLARHTMALTATASPEAARGALDSLRRDASDAARARADRDAAQKRLNARERMDLLAKLEAAGVHTPGELYESEIADGKIVGRKPSREFGPGPEGRTLANLRAYTERAVASTSASPRKASPYEPDRAASEVLRAAGDIEAEKQSAVVQIAAKRSTATVDQLAASAAALKAGGMIS